MFTSFSNFVRANHKFSLYIRAEAPNKKLICVHMVIAQLVESAVEPNGEQVKKSQVDSPESPEMPEILGMMEHFTKVTKYLTKLKETLKSYVWKKSHVKKQ